VTTLQNKGGLILKLRFISSMFWWLAAEAVVYCQSRNRLIKIETEVTFIHRNQCQAERWVLAPGAGACCFAKSQWNKI
jgi:hypothetical protein